MTYSTLLHVDASREGLGGVLYQEQEGGLRTIAYVSQSLIQSKRNYPVHKLEFLALIGAVVDQVKNYLYGASFVMKTDNNPLTYLLSSANLDATRHRWLAVLSGFQFSLKYCPGTRNRDVDALSQRPYSLARESKSLTHVTSEGVQALCQGIAQCHN